MHSFTANSTGWGCYEAWRWWFGISRWNLCIELPLQLARTSISRPCRSDDFSCFNSINIMITYAGYGHEIWSWYILTYISLSFRTGTMVWSYKLGSPLVGRINNIWRYFNSIRTESIPDITIKAGSGIFESTISSYSIRISLRRFAQCYRPALVIAAIYCTLLIVLWTCC